ncbi:unnamed protein product, partial [marine sediment metagenome]
CQETYQRMLRYVMARWGYSSHIMSWELCSEMDLVSDYQRVRRQIMGWHTRCAKTIRQFDQNSHMITTNFANIKRDPEVLRMPEVMYTGTNYYHAQMGPQMRNVIFPSRASMGKPAFMTEAGYDWRGSSAETTTKYLHLCLWSSYMIPFSGAATYWWWVFIDDKDLYPMFRPLVEYAAGEDMRGRKLRMSQGVLRRAGGRALPGLVADVLQNSRSAYVWVYERGLMRLDAEGPFTPKPRSGVTLEISGLARGDYR